MKREGLTSLACIALVLAALAGSSASGGPPRYDSYKSVPDVDKAKLAFPPGPMPDNSCWLACASNLLGGGGWGLAGNTPQQNADAIYGHLTGHFTFVPMGNPATAINWWLYKTFNITKDLMKSGFTLQEPQVIPINRGAEQAPRPEGKKVEPASLNFHGTELA